MMGEYLAMQRSLAMAGKAAQTIRRHLGEMALDQREGEVLAAFFDDFLPYGHDDELRTDPGEGAI